MLNQGFLKVERYHNLCQKQVKAQLPRYVLVSVGGTTGLLDEKRTIGPASVGHASNPSTWEERPVDL